MLKLGRNLFCTKVNFRVNLFMAEAAITLSPPAITLLILAALWTLPWKGIALWRAARNNHKGWFVALLVLNTLAILDITYIFYFSKKERIEPTSTMPSS